MPPAGPLAVISKLCLPRLLLLCCNCVGRGSVDVSLLLQKVEEEEEPRAAGGTDGRARRWIGRPNEAIGLITGMLFSVMCIPCVCFRRPP